MVVMLLFLVERVEVVAQVDAHSGADDNLAVGIEDYY